MGKKQSNDLRKQTLPLKTVPLTKTNMSPVNSKLGVYIDRLQAYLQLIILQIFVGKLL